ncbi:hypothetical protein ES702_03172 [subsurface metagenome]
MQRGDIIDIGTRVSGRSAYGRTKRSSDSTTDTSSLFSVPGVSLCDLKRRGDTNHNQDDSGIDTNHQTEASRLSEQYGLVQYWRNGHKDPAETAMKALNRTD